MPRYPRIHAPGLLYHVMARGNNGQKIFLKRNDYEAFLEALSTVRRRYPFYLYAYVLMVQPFPFTFGVRGCSHRPHHAIAAHRVRAAV